MMTDTPESVTLVPIDRIEVLNSRDRNMKVFEEIVENIRTIGLKKPITVTEREGADGTTAYLLVCGEGRLNAFRLLGETHIPALVVNVTGLSRSAVLFTCPRPTSVAVRMTSPVLPATERTVPNSTIVKVPLPLSRLR